MDPRLRDIVEGKMIAEAKKTQDPVAARDKLPRSAELQYGAAKDAKDATNATAKGAPKAIEAGNVAPRPSSVIAESDAWPTPAPSSKKLMPKVGGSDVSVDEFYGPQVWFLRSLGRASRRDQVALIAN